MDLNGEKSYFGYIYEKKKIRIFQLYILIHRQRISEKVEIFKDFWFITQQEI